jgi:hypothetical protein
MNSEDSDLDVSWIEENEKIENIDKNFLKEPMDHIDIFFIFTNTNSYIEKIVCENHPLSKVDNKNVLKKEYILQLIQSKKMKTSTMKYKFMDLLLFNVDLEPEHIQNFAKSEMNSENSKTFFKVFPIVDDVVIPPSIFIFHNTNSIYFLFQQHEIVDKSIPKSILKLDKGSQPKTTKKVKIVLNKNSYTKKFREPE